VPAATPLPRGPSVLTLYSAEDLLTASGCPVCRYATEASDRYLGWFALEGHAQPVMITTLCASLGMCASHTRRLMGQPGASVRLTAVFRYVMTAARDRLAGNPGRIMTCPGCEHDDAAARRALETLLEGVADSAVLHRCQDLGGLCLPHLDAAAAGPRRPVGSLGETLRDRIAARSVPCDWLVGTDRDADNRAVLRRQLPLNATEAWAVCTACLAAAEADKHALERLPGLASDDPGPAFSLCAGHLADAATAARGSSAGVRMLLAWQARCRTSPSQNGSLHRLRGNRRSREPVTLCAVCRARNAAALQALTRLSDAPTARDGELPCVRHQILLRTANPRAGNVSAPAAVRRAGELADELAVAFDRMAYERTNRRAVHESDAWRRAAAFLDGAVFGGCPPHLR
jgi:hypothetical protein